MLASKCVLLFGLILTLLLDPIAGKKGYGGGGHRGGSHGYPSGGLSGGSHSYPSGGLSGGGRGHGYPSGGTSGGSHGYPSGGLSGGGQSHGYPSGGTSGGSHGYPSGGTSGGSHGYPTGGLSGSGSATSGAKPGSTGGGHNYPSNRPAYTSRPAYKNYQYSPPPQINYVSHGVAHHYPVYQGTPPTYVYQYKDSGSKYGTLLAGLALLNLGTLAGTAYAIHKAGDHSQTYKSQPGEVCKFGIKKENGDYEETKIDCQIISSFIYQDLAQRSPANNSTQTVTTTVTNITVVNTNGVPVPPAPVPTTTPQIASNVQFIMLPNGTLVDRSSVLFLPAVNTTVNATAAVNATQNTNNATHTSSVVTTTITNTTVVNALDVKGKPVEVTQGMQCFVIRNSPDHTMKKIVPCGLLQTYAVSSIKKNSAVMNGPAFTVLAAVIAYCVAF